MAKLDTELAAVVVMDKGDLQHRWSKLTGRPVPKISTAMLRLAVAYELQAKAQGGLAKETRQRLERGETGRPATSTTLRPGMRLARAFGDTVHVVTIGEAGEVLWNGKTWRSLSEVARAITGTRWSGPAFFGLTGKRKVA